MAAKRRTTTHWRWIQGLAAGVVGVGALAFAVFGGEFSILDMRRRRVDAATLRQRVAAARVTRDSLVLVRDSVRSHPLVIERIGRERYGLVRGDREVLYWAPSGESPAADSSPAR
jgi:cell division protein FtsB